MRLSRRRAMRALAVFGISSVAVPVGTVTVVLAALLILPVPVSLPTPIKGVASQISHIYDVNGNEIGVFREFDQNIPISPEDIPPHLKQAVISAEDRNFYSHGGIDVRATMRALWADIRGGGFVQGGSTITQQYVKNTYTGKERSLVRKIREAILARQLDRQEDKETILFKYLSTIYFGNGAYGVGAASETYFRKPVSQLTLSEAALLAGLIPAPSLYDPRANPQGAEGKRQLVLSFMREQGHITAEEHAGALAQAVWLAKDGPAPGPATLIHPPTVQQTKYPYFVDYVRRYLEARYGAEKVFRGGLQIHTTIDPALQERAEQVVAGTISAYPPPLEMALAAVEPPTGYVKAIVGGRDFYATQVNLALGKMGAGTGRQTGSAFKPFVLAEALEQGVPPTKSYSGRSPLVVHGEDFHNYGGSSYGTIGLRSATHQSVNTVYVQLLQDVGVDKTMSLARRLGAIEREFDPSTHGLSVALGALESSPLQMASAYGVFAARGLRAEPTPVLRVVDNEGNVLEDNTEPETERVLREVVADNVTDLLRGVVTNGTGTRANINRPAAGKTGTAQNNADAWFCGYTPTLSVSVWMGYSDAQRPMRLRGVGAVTGGSLPARVWHDFMVTALADVPVTEFNEPAPITSIGEELRQRARGGIDPGPRRRPAGTDDGGPYSFEPSPPEAVEPTTTTSTTEPPFDDGDGFDDGDDGDGFTTTTLLPASAGSP